MKERIARFGEGHHLVGILTDPPEGRSERPAFIVANAGIVHRVGPNRLHVRLARRLASAGFPVLRFDLSGLGDSAPRKDGLPYLQSRIGETRDAMNHLQETRGYERFVILGLCSGADHAFRVAQDDTRVVGAVMIDGYAYPSMRYLRAQRLKRLSQAVRRIIAPSAWWRVITGTHPAWGAIGQWINRRLGRRQNSASVERFVIDLPPRDVATRATTELADRNVRLLFLYTARLSRMYRDGIDGPEPFPPVDPHGHVRVACLTGTDHTLTLLSHQERLFDAVLSWANELWPAPVEQPT